MEHVIAIVALVLTGPLVGVELGVAAFTNPLVSKLPDDAYRVFRSGGSRLLGALMPFWYIGTLVVLSPVPPCREMCSRSPPSRSWVRRCS